MYYTVYKTTNIVNGKVYIGTHKTKNLYDGYLGSGTILKRAIKKYGPESFKKEILAVFDNPYDMFSLEAELVNEDFLIETNTYNLKIGGMGGWDYINEKGLCTVSGKSEEARKKFSETYKSLLEDHPDFKKRVQDTARKNIRKATQSNRFTGKQHSETTKQLMSEKASKRTGQHNSQFGTMWITDGSMNKKIKITDAIPDGFIKGRSTAVSALDSDS